MSDLSDKIKNFLLKSSPWCFLAITLFLFLGTTDYQFLACMDDGQYLYNNPNFGYSWKCLKPVLGLWTPLPQLSYLIDYTLGGFSFNPYIFRIHNILWHLVTAYMVWLLFRELNFSPLTVVLAAFLFAVYPQRVESVVWIAERKDVMLGAFYFASLAAFVHARKKEHNGNVQSWVLMLGALLCKPFALSLPMVMFLLEVYRTRQWNFGFLLKLWPYFLLAGIYYAGLNIYAGAGGGMTSVAPEGGKWLHALILMMYNYLTFAAKTFLPLSLSPLYPFFVQTTLTCILTIAGWIAIAALLLMVYWKKRNFCLYCLVPFILIFLGILLPVSGFFPFSNADFADRYSYLPSVFLLMMAANILREFKLRLKPMFIGLVFVVYAIYLYSFTWFYSPVWQNSETLLLAATESERANYRAVFILVLDRFEEERYEEAWRLVEKAAGGTLQEEEHNRDIQKFTEFFRGMEVYKKGQYHTAFPILYHLAETPYFGRISEGIRMDATRILASALAEMCIASGEFNKAAFWYEQVEKFYRSRHLFTHYFYGGIAAMLRQNYARAIDCFQNALQISPNNDNCRRNLENARKKLTEQRKSSV